MLTKFRRVATGAALLATVAQPLPLLAQSGPPPADRAGPQRPQPIAFDLTAGWHDLAALAELVREQSGVPGIALAVVRGHTVIDAGVSGVASLESGRPLTLDDSFEWGSLTKSVTGTLVARLIADGVLTPSTTIGEVFHDIPMREEYRAITIAQLMRHEAGLQPYTRITPVVGQMLRRYTGTAPERRRAFVADLLLEEPVAAPGTQYVYSNADIAVVAAMVEQLTGGDWEQLVRDNVFAPAGMTAAFFGAPSDADPAANRGHMARPGQPLVPASPNMYGELAMLLGPSGDVSSPIADMARYAMFHLHGEREGAGGIPAEVFAMIHSADPASHPAGPTGRYNYGWGIPEQGLLPGRREYWHNGSDGTYYAELHLFPGATPEDDLAVIMMVNAGGSISQSGRPILAEMARRYSN